MLKNPTLQSPDDLVDDPTISQVLLSISNDLASARTKDDLLDVLVDKLKAVVPFDDIQITLYNEEKDIHVIWAHRYYSSRVAHQDFDYYIEKEHPVADGVLNVLHQSQDPIVFDIEGIAQTDWSPNYMKYYQENGLAHLVGVIMRNTTTEVGGFFLTNTEKNVFTREHLAIIKGISSQLCIAASNVLANEAILKHEQEKTLLLSLSNAMATIRTKQELLGIVREILGKTTSVAEVMVSYYDPKKSSHYIYRNDNDPYLAEFREPGGVIAADKIFGKEINIQIIHAKKPVNFDVAKLVEGKKSTRYIEQLHQAGIRDFTGITMRTGDNLLGCLYIATKNDPRYKNGDFGLVQGIADQLSVALVNIETSEEILEREKEKTILLTISNDMAAIRNKGDLLKMVQKRLKTLVYFSHAVTAIADPETNTYKSLIVDPNSRSKNYPGFERIVNTAHSLDHPIIKSVLRAKAPLILDMEEIAQTADLPEWILMNYRSGIKELVITPLYNGIELIGFLILFSDVRHLLQEREIKLIQGISWQLSVAVANILGNAHIMERDEEKSALIDLSKNFAVIRSKNDLHRGINEKLKKLMSISHFVTFSISEDGKSYVAYSLDPTSITKSHPDYLLMINSRYQVNDGITANALISNVPVVVDLDEAMKLPGVPKYLQVNYDCGIREAIMAPLKDGEKKTGMVVFLRHEKSVTQNYLNLIQGISDQLAIAVANIRANEKIEQQLEEIDQYKKQLESENLYLQEEIQTTYNYSELIGNSPVMKKIFQLVAKVAESESSVLILGETGTGKELIARAIHSTSLRKDKVMIKVNCATLPANLIESELFGHERGSFTGATEKRIGKFELANNSTLFLDEVGELPLDLQVKLLRVLQEKEIERVGGRTTIKTNVRIIAATNRDLQKEVAMGSFRSDLFFRLNVFPINLPALRERKEDIPLLATHFLTKHAKKGAKGQMNFSGRAIRELTAYEWPGNVRELEHLIERSILLSNGRTIEQVYLPGLENESVSLLPDGYIKTIDEVEREHIISVLKKCNGKVSGTGGAAEMLKIPATTLSSKMLRLKIGKGLVSSTEQ